MILSLLDAVIYTHYTESFCSNSRLQLGSGISERALQSAMEENIITGGRGGWRTGKDSKMNLEPQVLTFSFLPPFQALSVPPPPLLLVSPKGACVRCWCCCCFSVKHRTSAPPLRRREWSKIQQQLNSVHQRYQK